LPLFCVLPGISSDHNYFLLRSFDIFTHPAGAAMTEQCREQEVISWRNSFWNEYPLTLQRCVPFITKHPFPSFNTLPLDLGDPDDNINDSPIFMPGLNTSAAIVSWIARSLVAMAYQPKAKDGRPPLLRSYSFMSDYALYSFGHMRPRLCDAVNVMVVPEVAHCNGSVFTSIQHIAFFMESTLKAIVNAAGHHRLYDFAKGAKASLANISVHAWMPRLVFCSIAPSHIDSTLEMIDEGTHGWADIDVTMLPSSTAIVTDI
jgi:hypothetical protein